MRISAYRVGGVVTPVGAGPAGPEPGGTTWDRMEPGRYQVEPGQNEVEPGRNQGGSEHVPRHSVTGCGLRRERRRGSASRSGAAPTAPACHRLRTQHARNDALSNDASRPQKVHTGDNFRPISRGLQPSCTTSRTPQVPQGQCWTSFLWCVYMWMHRAAQNDMGVCDAMASNAPVGKPTDMSVPHMPKVAGIDSTVPGPPHTTSPLPGVPAAAAPSDPVSQPGALIQDRLASWVSDLTTLHELTERLIRTSSLDEALREVLGAGAALVGARRGMAVLEPADGLGPASTIGLGLAHSDLGTIETVPRGTSSYGRLLDGLPDPGHPERVPDPIAIRDVRTEEGLDPRHREVAARLGYAASYALPSPPRRPAGSARPSGSTTSPPNPPTVSATSSGSTAASPPSTSPACSRSSAPASRSPRSPRSCSPAVSPVSPASSSPPVTAPARRAAATGTTRCRCPRAPSGSPSAPSRARARARSPPWDGCAPPCGRTR